MKKSIIKNISMFIIMTMFMVIISGCGADTKVNKKTAKGAYVEDKMELPKDVQSEEIISMTRNDKGRPVLYTRSKGTSGNGVYKYEQSEDENWEKSSVEWLKDLDLSSKVEFKLLSSKDGQEYFYYNEEIGGWLLGHLFKKTQDNKAEEIKLEGWDLKYDDPNYELPRDISLIENGNILVYYGGGCIAIFDKNTLKKIKEYSVKETDVYPYKAVNKNGKIICFTGNGKNQEADSITYFDEEFNKEDKIDFEKTKRDSAQDLFVEGNEIVMLNSDGIHISNLDSKMWETIVEGEGSSIGSPSLYEHSMIKGNDKEYYVLYMKMDESYELYKYYYNGSASNEIENEISVYSLEENDIVREAVSLFQRKHPNVKVNYRVSISNEAENENNVNKNDYIKTLNTEILSGNGPDIIVLDNLPIDPYIEKGGLADLSDVINPMMEEKQLLDKVVENNRRDGKIYNIPTRIKLPIVTGDSTISKPSLTFNDIVDYTNSNKGVKTFGIITYADLLNQFLPEESHEFYKDKKIDKAALSKFLSNIKAIGDNSMATGKYEEKTSISNSFDIASEAKCVLTDYNGIMNSVFEISMADYIKGDFNSFENSYVPVGQIGINGASKEIDLCKEFVKLILDEEVQDKCDSFGFSVNRNSLDKLRTATRDYKAETEVMNSDGSATLIHIKWPDKDKMNKLIDICEEVSNETINDEVLFNIILENSKEFFKGKMESDKCVDLIIKEAAVYLEE